LRHIVLPLAAIIAAMIVHAGTKRQVGAIAKLAIDGVQRRAFVVSIVVLCRDFAAA
jgi:uncharacterized membrane protein